MSDLAFRLRVRNQDDTADALVLSSVATDANPYVLAAPSGQGQSVDPIAGKVTIGSYTITVIDPDTGGGTRPVTAQLTDAQRRQQLMARRAFIEQSADGGGSWTTLVVGYVTRIRLVSALVCEVTIGDTQRPDNTVTIFRTTQGDFDKVSCLCGGPVRGAGWGLIPAHGPWRVKVVRIVSDHYVQLQYVSGFQRVQLPKVPFGGTVVPGYHYVEGQITDYEAERVNTLATPYIVWGARSVADFNEAILGTFPGLEARLEDASGTALGKFMPLARLGHLSSGTTLDDDAAVGRGQVSLVDQSRLALDWTDRDGTPLAWRVGDTYNLYVYPTEINAANPLHIDGPPVEVITGLWAANGITYDTTSATAALTAIGGDLRVMLRIGQSYTLDAFVTLLSGIFGLGWRIGADGERELFATRVRSSTAPATTITIDDLRDDSPVVFDVDNQTIVNTLTLKTKSFVPWTPSAANANHLDESAHAIDEVIEIPRTTTVRDTDADTVGEHPVTFDLPGTIYTSGWRIVDGYLVFGDPAEVPSNELAVAVAQAIFDRRIRGAVGGELACLPSVTAKLGETFIADVLHRPNDTARGGPRIVQVVGRTETPGGPTLKIEDMGITTQPATLPTFTLTLDPDLPRHYASVAITNAATLIADGSSVRVEVAFGASPTSWVHALQLTPARLATSTSFRTPQTTPGSVVNVRLRAEKPYHLPSAYTATQTVTLDDLSRPTGLITTGNPADGSHIQIVFTPGESDVPIVVSVARGWVEYNPNPLIGYAATAEDVRAEFEFAEDAGTTLKNEVGTGDATIGVAGGSWTDSPVGTAYDFDHASEATATETAGGMTLGAAQDFGVDLVFRWDGPTGAGVHYLVAKENDYMIGINDGDGQLWMAVRDSWVQTNLFDMSLLSGIWLYIRITYQASAPRLFDIYDQGIHSTSVFAADSPTAATIGSDLKIGYRTAGDSTTYFNGAIGRIRIIKHSDTFSQTEDRVWTRVATLPPGSTRWTLRGVERGFPQSVRVRHEEAPPFSGQSKPDVAPFSVGVQTPTLNPPTSPVGFVGPWNRTSIGLVADGTYGLEVTATELPSFVQFEVAVETAVGSGTYGSYSVPPGGIIQSIADGPTRFVGTAPLDGLRRSIRAKHIRLHQTDSSYTTPVVVNPGLYAI